MIRFFPARLTRLLHRAALLIVVASSTSAWAYACDSTDTSLVYPWTDPSTFARPRGVVPPEYPPDRLKAGVSTHVEAALRIDEKGELKEVLAMKADNGDELFEKAVREVVRYWSFESFVNCECRPVDFTARLTVWFEIKDGKPSISVSRRVDDQPLPGLHSKPLKIVKDPAFLKKMTATYPLEARRAGKNATVYAMVTLTSATGIAEKARIVHVDTDPAYREYFGARIEEALKSLRYEPVAGESSMTVSTCFQISYSYVAGK